MSGRKRGRYAVTVRPDRAGGTRADPLVLGAIAVTVAGIAVRELVGPGSLPAPPGRLVQVGGRSQHVLERKGTRRPTIVFENGLGNPVTTWGWLFGHLPQDTQLIAYDRPGIGWSPPARSPLDVSRYPPHLLSLLAAAGAPPPYLLVGQSLGGLLIRLFAERHPRLTAGLVFVDATHPDEFLASSGADLAPAMSRLDRWIVRAALGMPPDESLGAELASLPPALAGRTVKAMTRVGSLRAARRELASSRGWAAGCDRAVSFAPLPVAVVSAARSVERKPGFAEYQDDLARLSDVSRSYIVADATHDSLLAVSEHAWNVAEAVVWTLDRTRL